MKKNELLDENLNLRKKIEKLTTKNRSLEVLSDDLKSENKTLKSMELFYTYKTFQQICT